MRDVTQAVAVCQHAQKHAVRAKHEGALRPSPAPLQPCSDHATTAYMAPGTHNRLAYPLSRVC